MAADARSWIEALTFVLPKPIAAESTRERQAKLLDRLAREGTRFVEDALASLPSSPGSDSARHAAVRAHRTELSRAGLAAYDAARFASAALAGVRAGLIDDAAIWPRLLLLGHGLQQTYGSWQQYAAAFDLGRAVIAGGHARAIDGRTFPTLPWKLDLEVAGPRARARYRRSTCAHCGGIKELPSLTAYVYCDFCGELCDYDFQRAKETAPSAEPPGRERLERRLDRARAAGDRRTYRKLQAEQYAELAGTLTMTAPRIGDPVYREAWIAFMADALTAFVFDDEAMRLDAAFHARSSEVELVEVKQQPRVLPASFPPVIDAFLARRERLVALYAEQRLLERHPDRPTPALWQRLEHAMFAQQWLPMLDERTAQAMLERLGLTAAFDAAPPGKRARVPCHRCGVELTIVAGARRVTCEHCGHRLDLVTR